MSDSKFSPGDIVAHVTNPDLKMVVFDMDKTTGMYFCQYYNPITGLFAESDLHEAGLFIYVTKA